MKSELALAQPGRLRTMVIRLWHPTPIRPPKVEQSLRDLLVVQRYGEVVRYSCARLEYWVSPSGLLREWARFNISIGLLIGLPAVCVVPVITFLLGQFTSWTEYLVQIVQNLLRFPFLLLGIVAVLTALLCFLRGLLRK